MPAKKISHERQVRVPFRQDAAMDDTPEGAQPEGGTLTDSHERADFPIVGIGASAGGLTAFEAFFRHMPAESDSGIAFVLVQHLAPEHTSLLSVLIQRFTRMPVVEIVDGMVVQRNSVYIIPPNKDLSLFHGCLHLMEPVALRGVRLPIDHFLRSLAQETGEAAIGLLLSGAGSDGSLGVRAIKEAGGMVMVQTPESAEYDGMPQSALATGLVDYILPPEEMPAQLCAYLQRASHRLLPEEDSPAERVVDGLQKIFLLLREYTRHDFSDYKQNTILRRIQRRMVIHQVDTMADYVHYLQQTPQELTILFRELLIGVTRFFRDAEAFAALKAQVLPRLFDGKHAGDTVRVWVPACSTGEEAYSLAMLLHDYTLARHDVPKVQLFATDIDQAAIETARAGLYPGNIIADVPQEYLTQYFTREEQRYRVSKDIRDMVVFAQQDIIQDPPFSHMDMISCRNLLIYLNTELQKKLLPLFHYALNANGTLFIGSSETVGEHPDLFVAVHRKWKIYQRKEAMTSYRPLQHLHPSQAAISPGQDARRRNTGVMQPPSLRSMLELNLLAQYTPPSVLINEVGEVLYVHGSTGRYLEPASGEANLNILRMARPGLRLALATAVHKAVTQQKQMHCEGLQVQVNERMQSVNLHVSPLNAPPAPGLFLVVFDDVPNMVSTSAESSNTTLTGADQRIAGLEGELRVRDEYLQTNVEELITTNEELQSANEELQSTNEEMDTSREELQSVNEELTTVNAELQMKIDELSQANDDMNNLLAGTDVGTVFIDGELRIQRFTPTATDIVHLIQTDIGRPIAHLATNLLHYDTMLQDARHVFETLSPKEVEVQTRDGRWYLMRILPYRTQENVIDGVVLTFVNITALRAAQERLLVAQLAEQAYAIATSIVETVKEPLLVLDADLRVCSVNTAFTDIFHMHSAEAVGQLLFELGNGQWNIPDLRTLLEDVLPKHTTVHDYMVRHRFAHLGPRVMRLNARELRQRNDQPRMILLAINEDRHDARTK